MRPSRRTFAVATIGALLSSEVPSPCKADDVAAQTAFDLRGIWSTHYQQTFIYLIIETGGHAVFALLDQGHSFSERKWFSAENGIIISGYPMFRIWKSDTPDRINVRMQAVPPEATNDTFYRFPLNFYMKRQGQRPLPEKLSELDVPANWLATKPPIDFNVMVGKPREKKPN